MLCLLVPTIGSFYPLPPYPVKLFPYIFLGWMAVGAGWLFIVNRRQPGILADIEADLERAPELIERGQHRDPRGFAAAGHGLTRGCAGGSRRAGRTTLPQSPGQSTR